MTKKKGMGRAFFKAGMFILLLVVAMSSQTESFASFSSCLAHKMDTRPRLILIVTEQKLGSNLVNWMPSLAAIIKSGRFSEVHFFSNIAELVPEQSTANGTFYIPHSLTVGSASFGPRDEKKKVRYLYNSLKSMVVEARPGDVYLVAGQEYSTKKLDKDLFGAASKRGASVHFGMDGAIIPEASRYFEKDGFQVARYLADHLDPEATFDPGVVWTDLRDVFSGTPSEDFAKRMTAQTKELFKEGNPSRPFDLMNLNAGTQINFMSLDEGEQFFRLIELRLERTQNNIVIPPFGLADAFKGKLNALKKKFPDRVFDASKIKDPGFLTYLAQNAQNIVTPDPQSPGWDG